MAAYVRHYLPADHSETTDDDIKRRMSLFQLSAVLDVCARGHCQSWKEMKEVYLGVHLRRNELCLDFYRTEIAFLALPNWNPTASAAMISKRVAGMRRYLKGRKKMGGIMGMEEGRRQKG